MLLDGSFELDEVHGIKNSLVTEGEVSGLFINHRMAAAMSL